MPRKSSKVEGKTVALDEFIQEQKAEEFMAEVSAPVEPEKKVELNGLLDKMLPRPQEEKTETTDIIDRILAAEPPKKKGRGKKAAAAPQQLFESILPAPVQEVVDVDEEKAKVLSKIQMNVSNFEVVLQDILRPSKEDFLKSLTKKGLPELRVILKTIEHTRAVNNTANQLKGMVLMGASGVEMVTSQLGLKTQGYGHMIRAQEEEIQSILREIALERVDELKKYQRPEVRLTLLLTTTLMAVDSRNRMMEFRQMAQPAPANAEEKYADL
jgi:hypothetical protein